MLEIFEWKDPDEVLRSRTSSRPRVPGYDITSVEAKASTRQPEVSVMNIPALAISSTDVRERVHDGRPIRYLVPEGVKSYIEKAGCTDDRRSGRWPCWRSRPSPFRWSSSPRATRVAPWSRRPRGPSLTYVMINNELGPLSAVIGTAGGAAPGALVIPGEISVTIPGKGGDDGRGGRPADPAGRDDRRQRARLLGRPLRRDRPAPAVGGDRPRGGIDVAGTTRTGAEVVALLEEPGAGRTETFRQVLDGVSAPIRTGSPKTSSRRTRRWMSSSPYRRSSASVQILSVEEVADGVFTSSPSAVAGSFAAAFGVPEPEIVPVIVLNGSGVPGVGELVAEQIVPGGFRIVVSENASNFDHVETLVVVGSADDVALGDRVRDLLGAGGVSVSVSSGIAPVTIVVGKDFTG